LRKPKKTPSGPNVSPALSFTPNLLVISCHPELLMLRRLLSREHIIRALQSFTAVHRGFDFSIKALLTHHFPRENLPLNPPVLCAHAPPVL